LRHSQLEMWKTPRNNVAWTPAKRIFDRSPTWDARRERGSDPLGGCILEKP